MDIDETLKERGQRYGKFEDHARITQNLKASLHSSPTWNKMADDQKEALEMIVHKIARILNGQADYADSWHDIEGYAHLVTERLSRDT